MDLGCLYIDAPEKTISDCQDGVHAGGFKTLRFIFPPSLPPPLCQKEPEHLNMNTGSQGTLYLKYTWYKGPRSSLTSRVPPEKTQSTMLASISLKGLTSRAQKQRFLLERGVPCAQHCLCLGGSKQKVDRHSGIILNGCSSRGEWAPGEAGRRQGGRYRLCG